MDIIFTGSFDPPTLGHLSIIKRAAKLLGSLTIVVCDNLTKKHMFTHDERLSMVQMMVKNLDSVDVVSLEPGKMLADFILKNKVSVLVRGIRNSVDLEYERTVEDYVKAYWVKEVIYLLNDPALANISSTSIRNHLMVMKEHNCLNEILYRYVSDDVIPLIEKSEYLLGCDVITF